MRLHHVAFLLPTMLVVAPPIATASANQARATEAAQTVPPSPVAEAANAPGQPIKGVIVKGGGPNKPAQVASEAKTTATTPQKPGGAVSPSYAACAPGNPIGGVIVKGAVSQADGAAASCVPPASTAKSISEKGVSSTKSR